MPYKDYTDEDIIEAVKHSISIAGVLKKLNLKPAGGNYKTIKDKIQELGIDTSHLEGQSWRKGSTVPPRSPRALEEILVVNSPHKQSYSLKLRLIREGLFEEYCYQCRRSEWNGQKIPLELEHINGISNDNRIENLTLLCPNCHALTSTYRGKNIGKRAW